jgi:hypothetical protein
MHSFRCLTYGICVSGSHAVKMSATASTRMQPGDTAELVRMVQASMSPMSKIRRGAGMGQCESTEGEWGGEWCLLLESALEDVVGKVEAERERRRNAPLM